MNKSFTRLIGKILCWSAHLLLAAAFTLLSRLLLSVAEQFKMFTCVHIYCVLFSLLLLLLLLFYSMYVCAMLFFSYIHTLPPPLSARCMYRKYFCLVKILSIHRIYLSFALSLARSFIRYFSRVLRLLLCCCCYYSIILR